MLFQNKTKRDCFKINHRKKNLKFFLGVGPCGVVRFCGSEAHLCGRVSLQCACVRATACDLRMTVTMRPAHDYDHDSLPTCLHAGCALFLSCKGQYLLIVRLIHLRWDLLFDTIHYKFLQIKNRFFCKHFFFVYSNSDRRNMQCICVEF